MLETVLVVCLVVWLIYSFAPLNNGRSYNSSGGIGIVGTIVLVLVVLWLFAHAGRFA